MVEQWIDVLFKVLSFSPGPFWILLVFFPKDKWAMLAYDIYLFSLSIIFTVLTIPQVPHLLPVIAQPTFEQINLFIGSPIGTLGSWNHMILGDLWIGRWVVLDAISHKVSLSYRLSFLALILFFGPLGLCFYLFFRLVFLRKIHL